MQVWRSSSLSLSSTTVSSKRDRKHVRRLLDGKFAHNQVHETPAHFKMRMERIADHMNSPEFAGRDGTGLLGLAKELRPRCEVLIKAKGERLPK